MAETQSISASSPDTEYWCYHCDKRVRIETLTDLPEITCAECNNGFVESISAASEPPPSNRHRQEPSFSNQFLEILRLIAEASHEDDDPPPPPPPPPESDDLVRIELGGWINDQEDESEEEPEEDEEEEGEPDPSENQEQEQHRDDEEEEEEEDNHGGRTGRNRIMDWSEMLMGLQGNTRFEMPEWDEYVGNSEDYVDAAGYEAFLHNLLENDEARRGAPPASKSAISALDTIVIAAGDQGSVTCAICREALGFGEKAKKLPCQHGYHEDCILTWLGLRNTCPVCRFELPTDDSEYEELRNRRSSIGSSSYFF